jgi:hypothetical protein
VRKQEEEKKRSTLILIYNPKLSQQTELIKSWAISHVKQYKQSNISGIISVPTIMASNVAFEAGCPILYLPVAHVQI